MSGRRGSLLLALGPFVFACAVQAVDKAATSAKTATPASVEKVQQTTSRCIGSDSIVDIAPGHIGALRLDTTLGAIQRECPDYGWTTIHGDERLDTAILITRPGLRVAGSLAIIDDEGGERHPTIDSAMRVQYWEVTGTNARLPKGVPIDGTWDDLRRAFGEVRAEALNGEITVFVCGLRDIQIQMAVPNPGTDPPINPVDGAVPSQLVLDSLLGKLRIERVFLASPSHAPRYRGGCA